MEDDAHAAGPDLVRDLVERLFARLGIGGVHVEEARLPPHALDLAGDALDVRHRLAAVEMDAEDVRPGPREGEGVRLAEAARRAEDERPFALQGAVVVRAGCGAHFAPSPRRGLPVAMVTFAASCAKRLTPL